jgi:hypothetical protein
MRSPEIDPDDGRFIAGIYNYCDRWCERCRFTDRCRVYAAEQKQWERHLLRGEDPEDPAIAAQDVADSLSESIRMLTEIAAERGIDLEALPPPEPRRRTRSHPLRARSMRWTKRVAALLKRMRDDLPGVGADLAAGLSDREEAEAMHALEGLNDAHAVLCHYHVLIPAKIARATEARSEARAESDPEFAQSSWDDALGTAKIVHECLGKAAAALWTVGEFSRDWQDEALPLAAETESLRRAIDRVFPGHQEFRRPGLDEDLP